MSAIANGRAHLVVLPGDGIGPEITQSAIEVLETVDRLLGLNLSFEMHDIGLKTLATHGTAFPDHVWEAATVPENRTRDLGGSLGTREFTRRVLDQLARVHGEAAAAV